MTNLRDPVNPGNVRALFVLPSLMTGGAEIQLLDVVSGFTRKGFVSHLLCFDSGDALRERALDTGASCHFLSRQGRLDYTLAKRIAEVIDDNDIDVVHCSLMIALFYGWLGVRLSARKPRLVAALHTTVNRNRLMDLQDWLVYRWILRGCDRVVFVCNAQRDHWCRKFRFLTQNSEVIHNGIDTGHFSPDQVPAIDLHQIESRLGPRSAIVTHIAAFRPEKGHAMLLRSWSQVLANHAGARLVFAGDGALRQEMQQMATTLGLGDSISWLGVLEDVRPLLALSDVVVVPSAAETFSMATLEAMGMAIPVVATDVGGAGEAVISGETGELVEAGDDSALAAALSRILGDRMYRDRLGKAARERVVVHFGRAQMTDKTADLLVRVVSGWHLQSTARA